MTYNKNEQIFNKITDKFIKILESGNIEKWVKTWSSSNIRNLKTNKSYEGINILLLGYHMIENGFKSPYYITFNQCKELKGYIKAGAISENIVFCDIKPYKKIVCNNCLLIKDYCKCGKYEPKEHTFKSFIYKTFNVFNIEQTSLKIPEVIKKEFKPIKECENTLNKYKDIPLIVFNEQRAYYKPSDDLINMPKKESFINQQAYYGTLFHELIHSTGHKKRLNRDGVINNNFFGSTEYSKEELVAELGAVMLRGLNQIDTQSELLNSASYINGWLNNMKQDKKFIFSVIGQSKKAVNYILNERVEA